MDLKLDIIVLEVVELSFITSGYLEKLIGRLTHWVETSRLHSFPRVFW